MLNLLSTVSDNTYRVVNEYATPAIGWYWRSIGGLLIVMVVGLICWAVAYSFWSDNNWRG